MQEKLENIGIFFSFLGKIHGIGQRVDAKIRNVIGDLLGKRLRVGKKKQQQPKEKQHNTHTTTIKNERNKKLKKKSPV